MTDEKKSISSATNIAQALGAVDPAYKSVIPGIYPGTTYEREADGSYPTGRVYSRDQNPNYELPEQLLCALEGGREALLFSSGMSAALAVVQALRPGDHMIAPAVMYWSFRNWLLTVAKEWKLEVSFVPNGDIPALEAAVIPGKTKLLWLETPANPTWVVDDIAEWARVAKEAGAHLAVDNTVATPLLTNPLKLGADIVMHSATKYLNGHSDVLAGALITAAEDDFWARVQVNRKAGGAIPGPFEAWLLLRGMRTLHLRVERASQNAMAIARHSEQAKGIRAVLYPGLESHEGHAIAARQMKGGFGGMMSLCIEGGTEAAMAVAARLKLFKRATSLGGVESLVEHRASIEGEGTPCPPDLLRLSIGIESADDLVADIEQALEGRNT
ncbi:trans-sulfuration enzyme family protein [Sneathiella litorea]|uniref:Aminotransferase class I/II-fold pyridoxal phosphate-dependent enzyme n=1 Tax=Sneathiella litorea TaxID=2606216 RepID=A0A6L8W991_9PROT|nr:PLP-dependent aspartate aminotransferase family protein [Sneathiella litorea]MZR31064.1 aminotransferase class I/II-fold pyridoxal phosphate-dependent enzyme [Sneathiella litorea]